MGQVLHGSATTTEAIRRTIQHSQESLRVLARRYGINPKTVAKWRRRTSLEDVISIAFRELPSARGQALLQFFEPIDDDSQVRDFTLFVRVDILDHDELLAVGGNVVIPRRSPRIQVIRLK